MTYTNTQQKAPRACDSEGLHADTNESYFASHGPIQQAPDAKAVATQIARLALAGHVVIKGTHGDFTCCKFGLTRYCADLAALEAFAKKVGVRHE
ncbi:MAG: hypothetical protein IPN53_17030 [Comamonadaceae bacterium]|nr:hypothetical protein [Comamonadaceae bacterium]